VEAFSGQRSAQPPVNIKTAYHQADAAIQKLVVSKIESGCKLIAES
jgi:hypothetical protein